MTVDEIISAINGLSVLELVEMKDKLQDQWGVSAAAPVAIAAVGAVADAAPAEEEKEYFKVSITDVGAEKIQVIKTVREITNLGLKEAKELVEALPAVVGDELPKDEANAIKEKLEAQGAKVELS